MTAIRKKILFVSYIVVIGVVLLYVLFPSNAVRNALVNRLQREVPDLRLSIGNFKLVFPPALSMKNVTCSNREAVLFSADRLTLKPRWMSLVTSARAVEFEAMAYQGTLSGVVSSMPETETDGYAVTGNFSELQLDRIPELQERLDMGLSGRASGKFHFDDLSAQRMLGSGKVIVEACTVILSNPILDTDRLSFERIDIEFDLEGNKLELQQGDFKGAELDATLSGTIVFESPTDRSVMDLDIFVTPRRLFLSKMDNNGSAGLLSSILSEQENINLKVTGPFRTPRVAFGASR